jgi:hypothetical protein
MGKFFEPPERKTAEASLPGERRYSLTRAMARRASQRNFARLLLLSLQHRWRGGLESLCAQVGPVSAQGASVSALLALVRTQVALIGTEFVFLLARISKVSRRDVFAQGMLVFPRVADVCAHLAVVLPHFASVLPQITFIRAAVLQALLVCRRSRRVSAALSPRNSSDS